AGELARAGRPDDLAPGDLAAWQAAWAELALRGDRWIEVRVAALAAAAARDPGGTRVELGAALRDQDPALRRAALPPVPPAVPPGLAGATAHDADAATALDAAQSLCLSLEASPSPRPILDALGPSGLARLRALVTAPPANATAAALRDAARCLAADRSPES